MKDMVEVWYLYHSGFAVKINHKILIFDYFNNQAANNGKSLYNGILDPIAHRTDKVFVFSSHKHHDHFNPVIFKWEKDIPDIHFILSSDISGNRNTEKNILFTEPDEVYSFGGVKIKTLASTDEGVAFLVQVDDITLYHAGDLHWWHWEGEEDSWNLQMEQQFKYQIAQLKATTIDIAFLPVDPRQGKYSTLGLHWFVNKIKCAHIFPMHFGDNYSVYSKINSNSDLMPYLENIYTIESRGQYYMLEL